MNLLTFDNNKIESELIFGNRLDVDYNIVVPTFNRVDTLIQTIESIRSQKNVDNISFQAIIVSNDPNFDISSIEKHLDEKFLVYRNKKNLGMVGNMNRCISLSSAKFVSYVQDDDLLLENYLYRINKFMQSGLYDCIIPNRYFWYDVTDKQFGKKQIRNDKIKIFLKNIFCPFSKKVYKVTPYDCIKSWHNCYGGGPTCGICFRRDKLIESNGFDLNFPYGFDYKFFIEFSENNNCVLLNDYLSIYRFLENASKKSNAQVDFFYVDLWIIDRYKENRIIKNNREAMINFSINYKSDETKKILSTYYMKCSKFHLFIFRISRIIYLLRKNLYRRKPVPKKLILKLKTAQEQHYEK